MLNAASRLVIYGAFVVAFEHPFFAMTLSAGVIYPEAQSFIFDNHARLHFFMAGVYTLIGFVVIGVVARTLLRKGRMTGWFTVSGALVIGGGFDLILGGSGTRTALRYTHRSTFRETDSGGRSPTPTCSPGSPLSSSPTLPSSARRPFSLEQARVGLRTRTCCGGETREHWRFGWSCGQSSNRGQTDRLPAVGNG